MVQPMVPTTYAYVLDPLRAPTCQPGRLVYCSKIDHEKLACFYKCCCFCSTEQVVKRTFVDVYTNGVLMNTPAGCCCCCWADRATMWYYDNPRVFGQPIVGGCCDPFPYFCPHCFGCCGDTLIFKRGCGCPNYLGHCQGVVCGCCCPIDIIFGLREGEALMLKRCIDETAMQFRMTMGNASGSGQTNLVMM